MTCDIFVCVVCVGAFDDDYDSDDMSYNKKRTNNKISAAPVVNRQPQQLVIELSKTPVKKEKKIGEKERKPNDGVLVEKKESKDKDKTEVRYRIIQGRAREFM